MRAYAALLGAQARAQAQYRVSFVMDAVLSSLTVVLDISSVVVLFRVTPSLGGFGSRDVLVMAGMCELGFQLADLTVGNIDRLGVQVRTGLLDATLTRPLGVLGQLIVSDIAVRKIGRVVEGLAVYVVALSLAGIAWTPARVVLAVLAPLAGAVLYGAVFVSGACVAFWWVESGEFGNAFTYGGREFCLYPVTVYPAALRVVFAYGLGMAFAAYQPSLALLGRADPLGVPSWVAWCTPLVAALAWGGALLLWRSGVRHYRSTGS